MMDHNFRTNWSLNIIHLIVILFQAHLYSASLNKYLTSEGNENQVALRYFKLSNHTLDQSTYYRDVQQCFGKILPKMSQCVRDINGNIFPSQRIWMPKSSPNRNPANRPVDCSYQLSQRHAKTHFLEHESDIIGINYHFMLEQSKCKSDWSEPGGSSFLVTAYDDDYLIACRYKDTLDDKYHISCRSRKPIASSKVEKSCLNLTVLLEYEHFDAFSESLTGETSVYLTGGYNSLRHVLIDNQQYCFEVSSKEHKKDNSTTVPVVKSSRLMLITGEWVSRKVCDELYAGQCYLFLNETNIQAYDDHAAKNELSPLAKGELVNNLGFPSIIRSSDAKALAERYLFHPLVLSVDPVAKVDPSRLTINFSPMDKSKIVHFVGSSHIRFSFDSIAELHGLGYMPGGFTTAGNMLSYHAGVDFSSIFADDQSSRLETICNTMDKQHNNTIVFMTGAWDLTFVGVRRIYNDPITGYKLASMMRRVLDGTISCPYLERFIWLTEIPYSPCYDDKDTHCNVVKGFRTNGAIAALNEYYVNALADIKIRDGLSFTIIDAFSIIAPRLQLLPDVEYDCSFHYHCRPYGKSREPAEPKILGHTPAGDAMVRAILLALS
jgi:hypothetical protein